MPPGGPVLNIGSSTAAFTTKAQPWIDEHVFAPMRARGVRVVNVDLKATEGVDLVGDICDAGFQQQVAAQSGTAILCSNLL